MAPMKTVIISARSGSATAPLDGACLNLASILQLVVIYRPQCPFKRLKISH